MENNSNIGDLMFQLLQLQKCSDDGKSTYKLLAGIAADVMYSAIESDSKTDKNAALRLGIAHISMLSEHIDTLYDAILNVTAGVSGELMKAVINDQTDNGLEDENDDRWLYL